MINRHIIIGISSIALLATPVAAQKMNLPLTGQKTLMSSAFVDNRDEFHAEPRPTEVLPMAVINLAQWHFRGIQLDQGDNLLFSNSLNRLDDRGRPFYIDIQDLFDRDQGLLGSDADTHQIGFVPPVAGVPDGLLQGQNAIDHGQWSYGSDFVTSSSNDGFARRASMNGTGIASTPWRVTPGLGDYYQIEMTANLAEGETVSLGYLGDIETIGTDQGLSGELGQLVLQVSRGIEEGNGQIDWTVYWDQDGTQQSFSDTITAAVGDELNLQLGWLDRSNGDDLFDAWVGDSNGNNRVLEGNMNAAIDVHEVGFYSSGVQSTIHSFTAAVPEPQSCMLQLIGLASLLITRRRS